MGGLTDSDVPHIVYGMEKPVKTTVYLDSDEYELLKRIARARNRATAEMVREAVAEYTRRHAPRSRPRSIGAGSSRRGDLSEKAEELLRGMGR
jgi:predicted transcriptional regulator